MSVSVCRPARVGRGSCLRKDDGRRRRPPRRAPALGTRFHGNDARGGGRGRRGLLVVGGPSTGSGRTDLGSAPTAGVMGRECGLVSRGRWWAAPAPRHTVGAAAPAFPPSISLKANGLTTPPPSPFERLRANEFGRRACGGEWGMRWGTETPRAAPLPCGFPFSPVRRWRCARSAPTTGEFEESGGDARGPPSCALRTGPSTGSGRTDLGSALAVGSGGCDGGWRRPALRPSGFLPSQE